MGLRNNYHSQQRKCLCISECRDMPLACGILKVADDTSSATFCLFLILVVNYHCSMFPLSSHDQFPHERSE